MGNKIRMKIGYKTFYNTLKKSDYGYTEEEIRELFLSVREMDAESRGWVINWIRGKGLPKARIEEVTATELVKEAGMQPINALIAIDWLKQEPEMAKYYIMKFAKEDSVNETARKDMKKIVEAVRKDKEKHLEDVKDTKKEPAENLEEMYLEGEI